MWVPTSSLYNYEIAAICGTTQRKIKITINELIAAGKIESDWISARTCNYLAQMVLIQHYGIDTSNEQQILRVLSYARDKAIRAQQKLKFTHKR